MFYSETFIDFNLTSVSTLYSMCVCHMWLKDLLTYILEAVLLYRNCRTIAQASHSLLATDN